MIRKTLTYLTILAITALPVQLISANAENVSMQMNMSQKVQVGDKCLHKKESAAKADITKSCCDEQSNNCQGCNDIPHATSVMTSPVIAMVEISLLSNIKLFTNNSLLHGISQKNPLRPPRTLI